MNPIKVICFYWQGDRWRDSSFKEEITDESFRNNIKRNGYTDNELASQYVNNLYYGVCRYMPKSIPFEFICFTNENLSLYKDITVRSFPIVSMRGVLPRLFMFSKESGLFGHQVLSLDIDVIIVNDLTPLVSYDGYFCTRSKFKPGELHKLDGDIMSFKAGPVVEKIFWTPFIKDIQKAEEITQGRERYWVRHVAGDIADRWDKVSPGAVVSYKWHCKKGIPKGACIISCHGYPRPDQLKEKDSKLYNIWNHVD